jgi:hypothetical protein
MLLVDEINGKAALSRLLFFLEKEKQKAKF